MQRIAMALDDVDQVIEVARQSPLLAPIGETDLRQLLARRPQSLADGECLFSQGDAARVFYLVVAGQVKLHRLSVAGTEQVVNIIGPGETLGEAVMFFHRQVFPVTAEAIKATRVVAIDNRQFYQYLQQHVDVCLTMLGEVSQRLHSRLNEVSRIRLKNAEHRLAWYLLDQVAEQQAHCQDREVALTLPYSKKYLASRLSLMPETLSRAIQRLSEMDLITVQRDLFRIADVGRLRDAFAIEE